MCNFMIFIVLVVVKKGFSLRILRTISSFLSNIFSFFRFLLHPNVGLEDFLTMKILYPLFLESGGFCFYSFYIFHSPFEHNLMLILGKEKRNQTKVVIFFWISSSPFYLRKSKNFIEKIYTLSVYFFNLFSSALLSLFKDTNLACRHDPMRQLISFISNPPKDGHLLTWKDFISLF